MSKQNRQRVRKYGEVYTPAWLVQKMCDLLAQEDNAFSRLTETFLEPACGNGNFLVEILSRKLSLCATPADILTALRSIYGIDILQDNVMESRARMLAMAAQKYEQLTGYTPPAQALADMTAILHNRIFWGNSLKILNYLETHDWEELQGRDWGGVNPK